MTVKHDTALMTIGELATKLGRPTHILRYWEKRFAGLRPLQRAGGRRHYRPEDVALAHRIDGLLTREGYTIEGAARFLTADVPAHPAGSNSLPAPVAERLRAIRNELADALEEAGAEVTAE